MPRHSAGSVGIYIIMWYVSSAVRMEADNAIILTTDTSANIFIALKWRFENHYGLYLWIRLPGP